MADELKTILIKDLQEAESAADTDYIAIDNGTVTKKIRVDNYNKTANGTAKSYAESAKESADKAQRNADSVSSTVTEITNNITAAQSAAIQAEKSAEAAESATLILQTYVNAAKESADKAKASEESTKNVADKIADSNKIAQSYAIGGTDYRTGEDTDNARYYYSGTKTAEANAETYKTNASTSASAAATSEVNAKTSETNAAKSATSASSSAESATTSKIAAATSEQNASNSADYARANATRAESYAIGGTSSRSGEDTDNAKYYAQQAKKSAELAAGSITGVSSFNGKTGAVTLSKADIGLGNVANYDQSKAIKSITRSGTTFTATALDGTTTTFSRQEEKSVTAGIVTVEDADGGDAGLTLNLEPHQSGSGDPSPDNMRPISGWTGVNVTRTGKNLLPYPYRGAGNNLLAFTDNGDGTITADGTSTATGFYNLFTYANPLRLKAGTYRISATGNSNIQWNFYYVSGKALSTGSNERTFTLTSDEDLTSFLRYDANVQYQNVTIKPMLVLSPETDLTYEPYSEQTYSITFPTEAGTVYGGSLDVTSGKLVVDRVGVTISDLTWTYDSSNTRFTTSSITNVIQKPSADNVLLAGLMSSAYTARAATQLAANDGSIGVLSNGQLLIKDTNYTVASNFVSAMGAQSIVYPLATPRTYQLTPTEVTMLIGHNTIWMDADGKIKLDYKTNAIATKGDINDHIANKSNPHAVTKAQVGLGSVANYDQSKAIKSITRNGTTFTATALDGTTTTFTQQDYPVATVSADGLMSKSDKAKLDGVADQASQLAKNTAQIETAGTATNAHSAGEYVMISNALYKVTASVAKGDTWTIGTNVTAASVGSEIGSLNSSIMTINSSLATQSKFVRHGFPNAASVNIGNAANGNWLCGFIACNIVNVGNFVGYFVFSGGATQTAAVTKLAGDWMTPTLTISDGKIILSTSDYKIANYVVLIND